MLAEDRKLKRAALLTSMQPTYDAACRALRQIHDDGRYSPERTAGGSLAPASSAGRSAWAVKLHGCPGTLTLGFQAATSLAGICGWPRSAGRRPWRSPSRCARRWRCPGRAVWWPCSVAASRPRRDLPELPVG
jgi:hypothetical protein